MNNMSDPCEKYCITIQSLQNRRDTLMELLAQQEADGVNTEPTVQAIKRTEGLIRIENILL